MRVTVIGLFAWIVSAGSFGASAQDRVALVIGVGNYGSFGELPNPPNDARGVAESLTRLGFQATLSLHPDYPEFMRLLTQFSREADDARIAVVFYAGHGMEVDGKNYLIPSNATLETAREVDFQAVSLEHVMSAARGATALRLIILDACRDNPYRTRLIARGATRNLGRGLAPVSTGDNTLVAYAAREGTVALDGTGVNSPYTTSLLEHIETPGLEIGFLFRRVRDGVLQATGYAQEPFTYGSLGADPIYLSPPLGEPEEQPATPPAPSEPTELPDEHHAESIELARTSYVLPDDGIRLHNSRLGPFCCTGSGLVVRDRQSAPLGYVYFFTWEGQAYNVPGGSIVPDFIVQVSGLADGNDLYSSQEINEIKVAARSPMVLSPWVEAGSLSYRLTLLEFPIQRRNDAPYFEMGRLRVKLDVKRN